VEIRQFFLVTFFSSAEQGLGLRAGHEIVLQTELVLSALALQSPISRSSASASVSSLEASYNWL
jgi:hypothetical protein